jgi:ssDNA-binding Zn-finger/Zn-ribbon topoisomerase 1
MKTHRFTPDAQHALTFEAHGLDEVTCPECHAIVVPDEDGECSECGADLSDLAGKKQDGDDDAEYPSVLCPTCGEEVTPDEDQRCPECHGDLTALIAIAIVGEVESEVERATSKAVTERDHAFAYRTVARILHLQKSVAQLKRRLASMDAGLAKLDARKAELAAAVEKVYDASRVRRPPDSLVAATAALKEAAARKKGELQ